MVAPVRSAVERREEAFSENPGLPVVPILGNCSCRIGVTRVLQRPDLGVETQDDGV